MANATGARPATAPSTTDEGVTVAVRIRPLLARDKAEGARECLRKVAGEPQVLIGADRAFTYNHVYDLAASQEAVFDGCVKGLVESVLSGYNATIFAYGQTGSGKTHTMGSSCSADAEIPEDTALTEDSGLVPRAIAALFAGAAATEGTECRATAAFIEIYCEEVQDLLQWNAEESKLTTLPIRETPDGSLTLSGQKRRAVSSVAEAMRVLADGSRNRATGSTAMNATSSRSHAIFSLELDLKVRCWPSE